MLYVDTFNYYKYLTIHQNSAHGNRKHTICIGSQPQIHTEVFGYGIWLRTNLSRKIIMEVQLKISR